MTRLEDAATEATRDARTLNDYHERGGRLKRAERALAVILLDPKIRKALDPMALKQARGAVPPLNDYGDPHDRTA